MLLANQHLPDGNQIFGGNNVSFEINFWERKFLSTSMFRCRILKKIFNAFFSDEMELLYLYLTATSNKEFTVKSSLTLFCAESSEKTFRLKYHIS